MPSWKTSLRGFPASQVISALRVLWTFLTCRMSGVGRAHYLKSVFMLVDSARCWRATLRVERPTSSAWIHLLGFPLPKSAVGLRLP